MNRAVALALAALTAGLGAGASAQEDAEPAPFDELDMLSRSRPLPAAGGATDGAADGTDPASDPALAAPAPGPRRRGEAAVIRALDKVTAKFTDIAIPVGGQKAFGTLTIAAAYCDKRPPEEFPETAAFLTIRDRAGVASPRREAAAPPAGADASDGTTRDAAGFDQPAFEGWMFASSPALNALEHPVYDVWVIDCLMSAAEN